MPTRRRFLSTLGSTALLAPAARSQAPSVEPWFISRGTNKEMRWDFMRRGGLLVPNRLFFVRNHTTAPKLDPASWRLELGGTGLMQPRSFTYDELLALPSRSIIRSLECAGNGRSYFGSVQSEPAPGTQWTLGAIGVAEWTGVPLREVLERSGLRRGARDVMPVGLDDQRVRRPLPRAKALHEDTLLVYAMNGETLPVEHGFPIRLLVPGWVGIASIKWVGRIEVSEQPLLSPWNTEQYVVPDPSAPDGKRALTEMPVKAAFELPPEAHLPAGRQTLRGRAWSGTGKIRRVEVSADDGRTWDTARLCTPNLLGAWVRWEWVWDAPPGLHVLRARATDDRGRTQPDRAQFNPQGYLFDAVAPHPVRVGLPGRVG